MRAMMMTAILIVRLKTPCAQFFSSPRSLKMTVIIPLWLTARKSNPQQVILMWGRSVVRKGLQCGQIKMAADAPYSQGRHFGTVSTSLLRISRIHNFISYFVYGFACHMHSSVNWMIVWRQKLRFRDGMMEKSIHGRGSNQLQFRFSCWLRFATWGEDGRLTIFLRIRLSAKRPFVFFPHLHQFWKYSVVQTVCTTTFKLRRGKHTYCWVRNGRLPRSDWEYWCNSHHARTCVVSSPTNTHWF